MSEFAAEVARAKATIEYLKTKRTMNPQEVYDITSALLVIQAQNVRVLEKRLIAVEDEVERLKELLKS